MSRVAELGDDEPNPSGGGTRTRGESTVVDLAYSRPPLPDPLVPPDVDLRGMEWMPLNTLRLMDSKMFAISTGDEFKAAVALWCKAWQQTPAGSLPDDERELAYLSGAKHWKKVRAMALHGFIRCNDGRYYHEVIAEKALEAWEKRDEFDARRDHERERQRRHREDRRTLFAQLRERGIVPPYDTQTTVLRDMLGEAGHADVTRDGEAPVTRDVTAKTGRGRGTGSTTTTTSSPRANALGEVASGEKKPDACPPCPQQKIIDLYHEVLPANPKVREWEGAREEHLRARWRGRFAKGKFRTTGEGLDWFRRYFQYVGQSKFLTGQSGGRDGRPPFVATLEWLVNPTNMQRVIEGKYGDA